MKNNITIAYILAFAKNTWFWLGIWVFYYLKFTNYAGIGLIETVLIVTMTLTEIPTGAIADILGKRKTLILAFLFEALGAYFFAYALNYNTILWSVFVMCVGGTLYSGTLDALVYDTLKENNEKYRFDKVISNISTISLITPALCGLVGGYLYTYGFRIPFILNAVGYTIGFVVAFFLVEPKVDTIKFSVKNYITQTGQGIRQLFKNKNTISNTILLLLIGTILVISGEMIDSFLSVEFGYSDVQMGYLWSGLFVVSAISSQFSPKVKKIFGVHKSIIIMGFLIGITFIISPYLGMVFGGVSLFLRRSIQSVFGNLTSSQINENTESKYRATTISTFNMINNIPYVLLAYYIGSISDLFSAKTVSFYLGITLILLLSISLFRRKQSNDTI